MKKRFFKKVTAMLLGIPLCISMATSGNFAQASSDSSVMSVDTTGSERVWDFEDGTQNWVYDDSWSGGSYNGGGECSYDPEKGMLKVSVDFSNDVSNGWSQTGISFSEEGGIDYSQFTTLTFDLYYDSSAYTTGQLTIKAASDNVFQEQMCGINQAETEDVDGTLKKASFTFQCDPTNAQTERPQKLLFLIVGNSTDYKGDLWFDNIRLSKPEVEDIFVDATVKAETNTELTGTSTQLNVNGTAYDYANEVQLVDSNADASTVAVYQYLKAVGESGSTLYGHMEDTVLKAGTSALSYSDTKDLTGSISAIVGLDCGNLFDGFADKYNSRHPEEEPIPNTTEGNIKAAALLSNEDIAQGAIMTLSAHMPNFAYSEEKETTSDKTYDQYDFLKADSYNLTGDCMNQILPGGQYHDRYNAYLDMVAEYAKQVNGPILFRPLHENTGSWFWWGKAFCDAETYKSVFKYTVEYLRDEKEVHNLIYVYGPGSEASSLEEYNERYPGDEYVDMVGFDTYDSNPVTDEEGYNFQKNFENVVKLVDTFAKQHNKLFAVTETGITSDEGGLPDTGNKRKEWFTEILDIVTKEEYNCSYFMIWSNYSKTGSYYTPFVDSVKEDGTLHGHEMMDEFIRFYNNEKSIFANDQKEILTSQNIQPPVQKTWDNVSGYITAPISGSRVLDETIISGRMNKEGMEVSFAVAGEAEELRLPTTVNGKVAQAVLTKEDLEKLGETANGKVILYAGETKLQEISVMFNIEQEEKDYRLVDDFESYYGLDNLLNGSWAVNKDSGCDLTLSLTQDMSYNGTYALKFDYTETSTGWAGATIKNEADWSDCNALQFWVVPDGKNQKTVIQINTLDGGSYEAYLNNYEGYTSTTEPLLVTIPFSEFVDKGDRGVLTSEAAAYISNFGLWLNAIPGSDAIDDQNKVSGTLYYDAIQAVYTNSTEPIFEPATKPEELPLQVSYRTHVQNDGWQDFVSNGEMSGTKGRSLRLEGIEIRLDNNTIGGSVEYRTHVQNEGWQDYVADGAMSGTKGKSLRLEAIQVRLTGEMAEKYDIYYRTHIQDKGWLGWAVNDGKSGSAGLSKRLEAIEIRLVEKGGAAPGSTDNAYLTNKKEANPTISYRTHVQNDGWQDYVAGGEMSGTKGRSLRLEAIQIKVNGDGLSGGVEYSTHVQNEGWQAYVSDDAMSGTKGKSLRLEAIKIRLTGELAQKYSVEYRTHVQNEGWQNWVKDNAVSGTTGKNLRLEAIEIRLVKK